MCKCKTDGNKRRAEDTIIISKLRSVLISWGQKSLFSNQWYKPKKREH